MQRQTNDVVLCCGKIKTSSDANASRHNDASRRHLIYCTSLKRQDTNPYLTPRLTLNNFLVLLPTHKKNK